MTQAVQVLVTGGAGYVGSQTSKALAANGYRPVVFDNLSTGYRELVRWGPLIVGDLCDPGAVEQLFAEHRFAAILHFAALSDVGESVREPARYWRNNLLGAINLLDAARRHGCVPIVFSSSCAVYGEPGRLPIREDAPTDPVNPYGRTKLAVEQALADHGAAYGLRSVCLRYFNAAGCDPEGETGESHHPETHLVPRAVMAALGRIPELAIYGDDYPTPDGTAVRDYVHVCDLADTHVAALVHLEAGGGSLVANLGTGSGFSVREILKAVERVTGRPVPHHTAARRPGDAAILVADAHRARTCLGFTSRHSGLDQIVRTAHRWIEDGQTPRAALTRAARDAPDP